MSATLENRSNLRRTYVLSSPASGSLSLSGFPATVTLDPYASRTVQFSATLIARLAGGTLVRTPLQVTDQLLSAYTDTALISVRVDQKLAAPLVLLVSPDSVARHASASGTSTFRIVNQSNVARSFALTSPRQGAVITATPSVTSVTIPALDSVSATVSWMVSDTPTYYPRGQAELIVRDGSYIGRDTVTIINHACTFAAPSVSPTPLSAKVQAGSFRTSTFMVKNSSSCEEIISLSASSDNSSVARNVSAPPSIYLIPGDSQLVNVSFSVPSNAMVGTVANLTLNALAV